MEGATILQVGPALSVRGGVASVERLIIDRLPSTFAVRHVATMEEGSLWRKLRTFGKAVMQLQAELRRPRPLVVHVHFASRGSTLRKWIVSWMTLQARRPLVLHAHGAEFDKFYAGLPRFAQRRVRSVFARADCFLVLSSQWREFYTGPCGLPPGRVTVLCNPTTLPATVPARAGRRIVQFLFLGRIGHRKGAYDLLDAFAALPDELRSRARLVFAGDGEVGALRAQAAAWGTSVEVHGWIDAAQRDALLERSDVFVLPSYAEGVPMALLEAMAHGLPVITTRVGGIPDIVVDGGEGLLVRPGQLDELQRALRTLIEDEAQRLQFGRSARLRAQQFDIRAYCETLLGIYRRLLTVAKA